jgi:hypothetical protein
MKLSLTLVLAIVLSSGTKARLFEGSGLSKPTKNRTLGTKKRPGKKGFYQFREPIESLPEAFDQLPVPTDTERKLDNVRITLTGIDNIAAMTSVEILFFEECFMRAFSEAQSSGMQGDGVSPRSLIVLGESNPLAPGQLRGDHERSLWRTPRKYYDIFALLEWSCSYCYSEEVYVRGTRAAAYPSSHPVLGRAPYDDDEATSVSSDMEQANEPPLKDELTDDTYYFSDGNVHEEEEFGIGDSFRDKKDDRQQTRDEIKLFEDLLCSFLRAGPHPAFHQVDECLAVFAE